MTFVCILHIIKILHILLFIQNTSIMTSVTNINKFQVKDIFKYLCSAMLDVL